MIACDRISIRAYMQGAHTSFWRGRTERNMRNECHVLHLLNLDGTAQETRPTRSNETNLLPRNGRARDGRCLTDVLMVTTTVRVVDGVHSNTTSTGPAVRRYQNQIGNDREFMDLLRLALNLWNARPALSNGLSILPPPATMPTVARAPPEMVFFEPEGSRILVLFSSGECPMTVA